MARPSALLLPLMLIILCLSLVSEAARRKKKCKYNGKKYKPGEVIEILEDNCVEFKCSDAGKKMEHALINDCTCVKEAVCPDGLFNVPGSDSQCFKFFPNLTLTWEASKTTCEAEGLELAKPEDPWALALILHETYYDHSSWLGAKGVGDSYYGPDFEVLGDGSVEWIRDGTTLALDDPAWWPGGPGADAQDGNCLKLSINQHGIDENPGQVYLMEYCEKDTYGGPHPLCELAN